LAPGRPDVSAGTTRLAPISNPTIARLQAKASLHVRSLMRRIDPKAVIYTGCGEPETGRWFRSIRAAVKRRADTAGGARLPKAGRLVLTNVVDYKVARPLRPAALNGFARTHSAAIIQ